MLCNATLRSTSHCITCINICQMLIQFEIFSGDELNKPMASVQILLLLYTTYSMYITCVIEIKYVYTKTTMQQQQQQPTPMEDVAKHVKVELVEVLFYFLLYFFPRDVLGKIWDS